jgi:hypothetical protein
MSGTYGASLQVSRCHCATNALTLADNLSCTMSGDTFSLNVGASSNIQEKFFFVGIYVVMTNKIKPSTIVPADSVCHIKHNIFTHNNPVKSCCFLQI